MKTLTAETIREMAKALLNDVGLLADRLQDIAAGVTAPVPGKLEGDKEILDDARSDVRSSIAAIDEWFGKNR